MMVSELLTQAVSATSRRTQTLGGRGEYRNVIPLAYSGRGDAPSPGSAVVCERRVLCY